MLVGVAVHRFFSEFSSFLPSIKISTCQNSIRSRIRGRQVCPGGGYFSEFLLGVCGPVLQTLTLFHTKLCNFPIPFFRPVFQNSYQSSDLVSTFHTRFCKIHARFLSTFRALLQTKTAQKLYLLAPFIHLSLI